MKRQKSSGAVMIELALILPLLVMLLLGAIHFGYFFYLYDGLEKSVRDGARYAASRTYQETDFTAYETAIKNVVVCGSPADNSANCSGQFSRLTVAGLTRAMVNITFIPATGRPERVRVNIGSANTPYTYTGVLSWLFGTTQLSNKPAMEILYFGRHIPNPKAN